MPIGNGHVGRFYSWLTCEREKQIVYISSWVHKEEATLDRNWNLIELFKNYFRAGRMLRHSCYLPPPPSPEHHEKYRKQTPHNPSPFVSLISKHAHLRLSMRQCVRAHDCRRILFQSSHLVVSPQSMWVGFGIHISHFSLSLLLSTDFLLFPN